MFLQESRQRSLANIERIGRLIEDDQYREAAELLRQVLRIGDKDERSLIIQLLMLARQICEASTRLQDEIEHQQQAQEQAYRQEQQLKEQMRDVLRLVVEVSGENGTPPLPDGNRPADSKRLWAALAQMLKWPRSTPTEADLHVFPPPPPALPSLNPDQLVIYCLGPFEVYRNDLRIENWPGRKGMLIFKYLLLNRGTQTRKEVLMDLFWSESDDDAQRNNLNVAIYGLRQALRNGDNNLSHILFQNDCYSLNPELDLWIDYEVFQGCCQRGKRLQQMGDAAGAVREFLAAANLYQDDFLCEDRYEDWLEALRHQLQADYLSILDFLSAYYFDHQDYAGCISVCNRILMIEPCFEDAHCRIMRCYCRQGQPYLALRQYDRCIKALAAELSVPPMLETENLHAQILDGQAI